MQPLTYSQYLSPTWHYDGQSPTTSPGTGIIGTKVKLPLFCTGPRPHWSEHPRSCFSLGRGVHDCAYASILLKEANDVGLNMPRTRGLRVLRDSVSLLPLFHLVSPIQLFEFPLRAWEVLLRLLSSLAHFWLFGVTTF